MNDLAPTALADAMLDHLTPILGEEHPTIQSLKQMRDAQLKLYRSVTESKQTIAFWTDKYIELEKDVKAVHRHLTRMADFYQHKEVYYQTRIKRYQRYLILLSVSVGILAAALTWG